MAKVTSKLQITIPKRVAEEYGIAPGDELEFQPAGDTIRLVPAARRGAARLSAAERLRLFDAATERQRRRELSMPRPAEPPADRGWTREDSTIVASLVDTNVLVYRFDPRDAVKQGIAEALLRENAGDERLVIPHQAIVEFVAAVTRPRVDLGGEPLLRIELARLEAEALMAQFPVAYPTADVLITALRGSAAYQLSWFDAHIWAYAEVYGLPEIVSEDFEHGRHYGDVRVVNPFLQSGIGVRELPPLYHEHAREQRPARGLRHRAR